MGAEKKNETKTETKVDAEAAPRIGDCKSVADSLESIAESLSRLADRFAPEMARATPGAGLAKITCPQGHAMQPADDYCQECYRTAQAEGRAPKAG